MAMMLQASCVGYFINAGVLTEREWTNPYQNYDNVGNALLSLFVAVTLNGYSRELLLYAFLTRALTSHTNDKRSMCTHHAQ